jgi:hypothetical protein
MPASPVAALILDSLKKSSAKDGKPLHLIVETGYGWQIS